MAVILLDLVRRPAFRIGIAGSNAQGCRLLAEPDAVLPVDVQHPGFALVIADLVAHLPRSEPILWRWQGIAAWLANGLALAALFGFWVSLRSYDMQEFLGLRQLQLHVRKVVD